MSSDRHEVLKAEVLKAEVLKAEVLKAWIAAILWLIVICIESTSFASAHNTGRILYPLLHFLFGLSREKFEPWHFFMRKGGHVFGYGLLSILLFRAWRATLPIVGDPRWKLRWASIAVLGTALVASLDEWHQSFLPSRTGRWQDVVLDTSAGIAAQLLLLLIWRGSMAQRTDARRNAGEDHA